MFVSLPDLREQDSRRWEEHGFGQAESFAVHVFLFFIIFAGFAEPEEIPAEKPAYEPTWQSLQKHPLPQWPMDAKFGILVCWGPYSVPAFENEWYPRNMYIEGHPVFLHHREKYGDPSRFGYKDFFPLFRAQQFNPEEWAVLFAKAGARFAGLVAEHIDGYSMWASQINRWNARDLGPGRNLAAELTSAIQKQGLKTVLSFHHAFVFQDGFPVKEGWDTADPQYADLYGRFLDPVVGFERWLVKVQEAVDQCRPDLIHFAPGLDRIPDETKRRMAAFFYNQETSFGKPLLISASNQELPEGLGLPADEPERIQTVHPSPWLALDSIGLGSRCYTESLRLKSAQELIAELIEVISKNGILLLIVSPRADGTIPAGQQQILSEIGQWLQVNGRAVYQSRPWFFSGEGGLSAESTDPAGPRLRFMADEKTLFLFALDWPQSPLRPESVEVLSAGPRAAVRLLGDPSPLRFQLDQNRRLQIEIPNLDETQRPCRHAYVFQLEGFELRADPFYAPDALSLQAAAALLEGDRLHRQPRRGGPWIIWEDPREKVHWLVRIRKAGRYAVRLEGSAAIGPVSLTVLCGTEKLRFQFPPTEDWQTLHLAEAGTLRFPRPGVYHLTLQAADLKNWRPLNLCRIRLTPQ